MKEVTLPLPILEGIKEDLDSHVGRFMSLNDRFYWLLALLEEDLSAEKRDTRYRTELDPALLRQFDGLKGEIDHELDVFEKNLFRLEQAIKIPRKLDSPSSPR